MVYGDCRKKITILYLKVYLRKNNQSFLLTKDTKSRYTIPNKPQKTEAKNIVDIVNKKIDKLLILEKKSGVFNI